MYFLGIVGVLVVAGALFGVLRAKRADASAGNASYRRGGFSGQ